jgi:hypothetical protein
MVLLSYDFVRRTGHFDTIKDAIINRIYQFFGIL